MGDWATVGLFRRFRIGTGWTLAGATGDSTCHPLHPESGDGSMTAPAFDYGRPTGVPVVVHQVAHDALNDRRALRPLTLIDEFTPESPAIERPRVAFPGRGDRGADRARAGLWYSGTHSLGRRSGNDLEAGQGLAANRSGAGGCRSSPAAPWIRAIARVLTGHGGMNCAMKKSISP